MTLTKISTFQSGNVQTKNMSLYVKTQWKFIASNSMKKKYFKAAIDQIERALKGDDPAPNSSCM